MTDMVVGDIELAASPMPPHPPTSTTPRVPSTRPHKKKKHRRRHNKVGALPSGHTEASDTVDAAKPHPLPKYGRNQRGRRFSHQGFFIGGGSHESRGIAFDAQRELAWMDMGDGGVQLMKIQPLTDPTPYPAIPTSPYAAPPTTPHPFLSQTPHPIYLSTTLPPLVSPPSHLAPLSSTPRAGHSPNKEKLHPQAKQMSMTEEKLPALSLGHTYGQQQLQSYFKIHQEMEHLGIHQTTPTPKSVEDADKSSLAAADQETQGDQRSEVRVPDVEQNEKSSSREKAANKLSSEAPPTLEPATPPPRQKTPVQGTHQSNTQELLQEAFGNQQPNISYNTPTSALWQQPPSMTTPYQLYAPPQPIQYHSSYQAPHTSRQLLWTPSEPHPMAPPTDIQLLSPAQLSQLRRNQDFSPEHHNQRQLWTDPHRQLPSHFQIRNQTDPF